MGFHNDCRPGGLFGNVDNDPGQAIPSGVNTQVTGWSITFAQGAPNADWFTPAPFWFLTIPITGNYTATWTIIVDWDIAAAGLGTYRGVNVGGLPGYNGVVAGDLAPALPAAAPGLFYHLQTVTFTVPQDGILAHAGVQVFVAHDCGVPINVFVTSMLTLTPA